MEWTLIIQIWMAQPVEENDAVRIYYAYFDSYQECLVASNKAEESHKGAPNYQILCKPKRR